MTEQIGYSLLETKTTVLWTLSVMNLLAYFFRFSVIPTEFDYKRQVTQEHSYRENGKIILVQNVGGVSQSHF